jgi:hypothetical protein
MIRGRDPDARQNELIITRRYPLAVAGIVRHDHVDFVVVWAFTLGTKRTTSVLVLTASVTRALSSAIVGLSHLLTQVLRWCGQPQGEERRYKWHDGKTMNVGTGSHERWRYDDSYLMSFWVALSRNLT